jgi:alkanesulfonate monooxygenase SsuD/methylene tetrahydromethanopterin reductase-like flavin-dependent oxidoreductase (luciferase family)
MHETVAALRSLLRGGEAEWGHQSRRMVIPRPWFAGAIEPRSEPVPIYMGAVGPKMTRLAGEIADGLLLEMEAVREFLPGRLQLFREGAAVSGRDPLALETVKLILASVGPEATTPSGRAVHHNALGWAAKSVSLVDGETVRKLKWDAERAYRIKSAWAAGDWEAGKDAMTPEMTLAFVAAGPPEHLAGVIRDTVATGVTTPVLIPYGGELRPLIEAGARFINGL